MVGECTACIVLRLASSSSEGARIALIFCRIETEDVVTASNMFKYCAPQHGLLLFKRHHPLEFTLSEVGQLLSCGALWFQRAAAAALSDNTSSFPPLQLGQNSRSLHPFLLWNCLPRAGASQFHGHAQVALSQVTHLNKIVPQLMPSEFQQYQLANFIVAVTMLLTLVVHGMTTGSIPKSGSQRRCSAAVC